MNQRPVYIDLRKIKLPMSAFSSITHRLSGMYIFFISLPLFSVLLYLSTKNKTAYENLYDSLNTFQIVLHEGSNKIETFIESKRSCTWNNGAALVAKISFTMNNPLLSPGEADSISKSLFKKYVSRSQ